MIEFLKEAVVYVILRIAMLVMGDQT